MIVRGSIEAVPYSAMTDPLAAAQDAAEELRRRTGVDRFDVAVVLGSGWKQAAADLGEPVADLETLDLPGFVSAAVAGHEGRIRAIEVGGIRVALFLGRTHLYEGHGVEAVAHAVRTVIAAAAHAVV